MNPTAETNETLNALPVFQPPATLGDAWDANWSAVGLSTPIGVQQPRREAVNDLLDAYQRATGKSVFDAAADAGMPISSWAYTGGKLTGMLTSSEQSELTGVAGVLASRLPDPQAKQVEPFLDVDARAAAKAQAIEGQAADVNARTFGLTDNAAGYVAGLARGLADPSTIAGALIGGPEGGGLATTLAREFAVNAGIGAAVHEVTAPERQALGLPDSSLLNDALTAGAFGAGLSAVLRGAAWTLRRSFGGHAEAPPEGYAPNAAPPADLLQEAGQLAPEDFEAAARVQDRDTAIGALAPEQSFQGRAAAQASVDAAAAHIETGDAAGVPGGAGDPTVRVYHGGYGDAVDYDPWVASNPEYARDYGQGGRNVFYADIPVSRLPDEAREQYELNGIAPTNFQVKGDLRSLFKRYEFSENSRLGEGGAAHPPASAEAGAVGETAPAEDFPGDLMPPRDIEPPGEPVASSVFREPTAGKAPPRPQSLLAFLKSKGGVRDQNGDLRDFVRTFPGLVDNKKGLPLDRAREAAAEAGYLGANRTEDLAATTPADLIEAIRNHPVYRIDDFEAVENMRAHEALKAHLGDVRKNARYIEHEATEAGYPVPDPEHLWTAAEHLTADSSLGWDGALERSAIVLKERDAEMRLASEGENVTGSESGAGRREGEAGEGDRSSGTGDLGSPRAPVRAGGEDSGGQGGEDGEGAGDEVAAPAVEPTEPNIAAQRADVERGLAEAEASGEDVQFQNADGTPISARAALSAVDEFKAAARELASCILKFGA